MPIHKIIQRNSSYATKDTPIPFDLARTNEGNAMNLKSGKFTAPRTEIYFFSFTGHALFPPRPSYTGGQWGTARDKVSDVYLIVYLYLNGGLIGSGKAQDANEDNALLIPLTVQSTLNLQKGDQVWVQLLPAERSNVILSGHDSTHFTGFILEEEIVASL